jgi:hypothetical protein
LEIRQNPRGANMRSSLPREESSRLAAIGKGIENVYGYPVDIEWSYDPAKKMFSIFQVRPINAGPSLALSYLDPQQYFQLGELFSLRVIGEGIGAVCTLTHTNTLVADLADKTTIATYERLIRAGMDIQAVIVRNPCGSLSHEALFFKSKGVPLVCPSVGSFESFTAALKVGELLMDVQEGIAALLPKGMTPGNFVREGLRRHMVPQQETAFSGELDPAMFKNFVAEINSLALMAKTEQLSEVEQIKQGSYRRNRLDHLLSCYELAQIPALKAYFLQRLLVLLQIQVKEAPAAAQKAVLGKAFYNACNLWNISQQADHHGKILQEKYAISWLRNVLVEERGIGIANSDTLRSVMGEVKESKQVNVAEVLFEEEGLRREFLDILLRSAKFAIGKDVQEDWIAFCCELSLEDLELVADIFKQLGPRVVGYWLNTSFAEARQNRTSAQCLQILFQERTEPYFAQALAMNQKTREAVRQFHGAILGFGHPEQFEDALKALENQLLPVSKECLTQIQTAKGLSATLLSYAFADMIGAFDESIKAVTGSTLYDSEVTRMNNFYRVLQPFHEIAVTAVNETFLSANFALSKQAEVLNPYLHTVFEQFGEAVQSVKDDTSAKKLTQPSKKFVVTNAMLGSGIRDPNRMSVQSLEDYFTLLHQSLLTVAAHTVQSKGKALSLTDLPQIVQHLCMSVSTLYLGDNSRPLLQSIEYSYPHVIITYNCPMNFHSASMVIDCQLEAGKIKSINLEGKFFASEGMLGGSGQRAGALFLYALDTYHPVGKMIPPEGYLPRFEKDTCCFQWKIPLEENWNAVRDVSIYLEQMINYLQFRKPLPSFRGVEVFRRSPEYFAQYLQISRANENASAYQAFLEGVANSPSLQTLELFLQYFFSPKFQASQKLNEVIRKVFESEILWNQPDKANNLINMRELQN